MLSPIHAKLKMPHGCLRLGLRHNDPLLLNNRLRIFRLTVLWLRFTHHDSLFITINGGLNAKLKKKYLDHVSQTFNHKQQFSLLNITGGCWAFSTVVSIEGINAIKTVELVSLSEQQLIDCANGINQGCRGGIMEPTFILSNYMEIRHPLITIDGFEDVSECNEEALIKAVANQPISAAIETNDHDFQFYNKVT
ncbi:putative zingipain [Helianthus annuus]|nr:putative zingipain [Helianthus annuus]